MSRIFQDGLELGRPSFGTHTSENYSGGLWLVSGYSAASRFGRVGVNTSVVRSGDYSLRCHTNTTVTYTPHARARRYLGEYDDLFIRVYFYPGSYATTDIIQLLDSNFATLLRLRLTSTGDLQIYDANNAQIGNMATFLPVGTWGQIEARLKVDEVSGLIEVKIDGESLFYYSGDTRGSKAANCSWLRIGIINGINVDRDFYFDDVAVNDVVDDGSGNDTWCGPGEILLLKPKANGDINEWTQSNETYQNWEMVNEVPHDGDDTYTYSDAFDEKDTYKTEELQVDKGLTPIESVSRVKAVQICFTGRWEGAGADILPFIRSGGVNEEGTKKVVGSSYHRLWYDMFSVNPFTGNAWNFDTVDALQVGAEHKMRGEEE